MKRPVRTLAVIAASAALAVFLLNFQIEGLDRLQIKSRPPAAGQPATRTVPVEAGPRQPIRIATWDWDGLLADRPLEAATMELLARHLDHFDLLVLHDVGRVPNGFWQQVFELAGTERQLEAVAGPALGPAERLRHCVLLLDQNVLRIDRRKAYAAGDPDQLFTYDPVVAHFASRAKASDAFTFLILAVTIDADRIERELPALRDLFFSARQGHGGEDDILLVGNLQRNTDQLANYLSSHALRPLWRDRPADVRGERFGPQILIDPRATVEYTGQCGAMDALRAFNLSVPEVEKLSPWMPIWADFTWTEGAAVAARPPTDSPSRPMR